MSTSTVSDKQSVRARIQKFGSFLSGMVMPNIGAFIAWGIVTALFIPTGWYPNKELAELVDPTIKFLLPLLIGYTGGKLVYDVRGGVIGAVATMGVIVGADIPMFLGAMIAGPLGGYLIKKLDRLLEGKIPAGFEMLVNNFSAGILGAILTLLSFKAIGPTVLALNGVLSAGVNWIINADLLPLANIIIEPAKVLFLNNAINHGVLSPIAIEQAAHTGKSILFLLETNPGPGLGILLAYWVFGKGTAKQTAPGSAIIQFFGGIHEIYFPYIPMNPLLILAVIGGGVSAVFVFTILGAGLVAVPSPGSIIALLAMTPKGGYFGVIAGIVTGAVISFLIAALILKRKSRNKEIDFEEAKQNVQEMKGKKEPVTKKSDNKNTTLQGSVQKIVFACDAGMGSSAMGASILRKKVKEAQIPVEVTNTAISQLPNDADIVVTHHDLTERAKAKLPAAHHISVENFLSSPEYDRLIEELSRNR